MRTPGGSGHGFCRARRLLSGADFEHVFQAPSRSTDRYFTVLVRENGRGFARLGLAVGKKRIRNAVGRNRIKRLARESFRHHGEVLAGLDVVVLCRFDGAATNEELRRSLAEHWRRLAARRP